MKQIILIGELLQTHKEALERAINQGLISEYINISKDDSLDITELTSQYILMKGYIHTDDFLRKIIPVVKGIYALKNLGKPLLTHCAVLKNIANGLTFILTDAACIPFPTNEQRTAIINNAIKLYHKISNKTECNVSLISAGGDTNANTSPELFEWWNNNSQNFVNKNANIRLEQLDVALNKDIRSCKHIEGDIANIVVCSDTNQGNSIWKCLTTLTTEWICGGILMGGEIPIILNSRGDTVDSLVYSIDIATR